MTEEQRDNILSSMSKNVEKINEKIDEVEVKVDKLEEKVDKLEEKVDKNHEEVTKELERQNLNFVRLEEKVDCNHQEVTKELERQRTNLAGLEYRLLDKIEALFDARQINLEKIEKHDVNFENVEKTLDWHHRRLLTLENVNNII